LKTKHLSFDSFEEYFCDNKSHEGYIWSLIFSQDGNYLFSGGTSSNGMWKKKKKF
jgi:WD40 repeat protein